MQRKFLEDLGIDKETIDKILDENSRDIGKAKGNYDDIKVELDKMKDEIKARDKQLEDLKKLDPEGLKAEIDKLQEANAKAKAEYEAKIKQIKIDNAVANALVGAKAKNTKAVMALLDLTDADLDGDTVKGLDEQIKKLQAAEDSKFLFDISEGGADFKGAKPGEKKDKKPAGDGTKNPWSKEHWNLTEQGRLIKEDPELAAKLKNTK